VSDHDIARAVSLEVVALLRIERIRRGISMRELAKGAGISQPMISYVERGMRIPTLDTAFRIANALEVDFWKIIKRASSRSGNKR
jgi:transcriptional regulator with XRE-family HTH domain